MQEADSDSHRAVNVVIGNSMLPLIRRNSDQGASEHNPTNLIVRKRSRPDANEWNDQEVVSRIIIGFRNSTGDVCFGYERRK